MLTISVLPTTTAHKTIVKKKKKKVEERKKERKRKEKTTQITDRLLNSISNNKTQRFRSKIHLQWWRFRSNPWLPILRGLLPKGTQSFVSERFSFQFNSFFSFWELVFPNPRNSCFHLSSFRLNLFKSLLKFWFCEMAGWLWTYYLFVSTTSQILNISIFLHFKWAFGKQYLSKILKVIGGNILSICAKCFHPKCFAIQNVFIYMFQF